MAYDNGSIPCYQLDFNAVASGKIIAMSKRRLRWRFGFPNEEALAAGKSGTDCRGEEHDVTLTWSVASGKRVIMANSRQIYCNTVKSSVFEYSWFTEKNHAIRICVYSTAPGNGARQYELSVNGVSFHKMPKIFEIGLKGTLDDRVPGVITNIDRSNLLQNANRGSGGVDYSSSGRSLVPRNEQEEQDELKRAIEASLKESRDFLASRGQDETEIMKEPIIEPDSQPKQEAPLIDLLSEPAPTPSQFSNTQLTTTSGAGPYQSDPLTHSTFPNSAAPGFDEFQPRAPTYGDISDQIMGSYQVGSVAGGNPTPNPQSMQMYSNAPDSRPQSASMTVSRPQTASSNPFDSQFGPQY